MTPPTQKVRKLTYQRDGHRCVSCGARNRLEWQHRQASGHGGRGSKAPLLTPADGITACTFCNTDFEGRMQSLALLNGWKVRRFCPVPVQEVPVWYRMENAWHLINRDGSRDRISEVTAAEYMAMAGVSGVTI